MHDTPLPVAFARAVPRTAAAKVRRGGAAALIALALAGGTAVAGRSCEAAVHARVVAVLDWLVAEFGLPEVAEPPRIAYATPDQVVALYLGDAAPHAGSVGARPEVVAVYHNVERTIYLPEGWTGASAAEMSVLVHELAHHVQNLAGITYACPAAREKLAFEAQAAWLERHGSDLESAFGIDAMTRLVRTNCF